MNYQDTSSLTGTDARSDADVIPAGSKAPAVGNTITGSGTVSGEAGADVVGSAPGQVVAIQGAGGTDTNTSGEAMQVSGRYGVLNMEPNGSYSYTRNGDTPDGVRDVFTYTLADSANARDTATLTIDIGRNPSAVQANAQQVVPGPDGVITLPAGVTMADVHVVGRNLVIDMPDGTQMIIVDGAVFVPQLVLGGVEIPATTLANLLVESEPPLAPTAGEPTSGGGNFGLPPAPLDPGVPLGDLIPPVEMGYQPPIFEDVGGLLDRKPEAGTVAVQLDDDAKAGGNPGGTGDDPDSVNPTGFLPGAGGDGALVFDLLNSGAPAGFTYVDGPNGSILVQQVQDGNPTPVTVLTITVNPATGAYTVTQNAPIRHAAGDNENNAAFTITYTATDEDGDAAIGTLTVNVDDDTPTVTVTAGPDANVILTTHDAATIGANSESVSTTANFSGVFTGTTSSPGADGAGSGTTSGYALSTTGGASGLTQGGVAINLYNVSGVIIGSTATTAAGITAANTVFSVSTTNTGIVTLTQFSQIDHTNTDPSPTGSPFTDHIISLTDGSITLTRTETVVDRDGDSVTGSAAVAIGANLRFVDDGPAISIADRSEPLLTVDETDLSTNATGSFAANFAAAFGADGPAATGSITYALGINAGATGLIDVATGQAIVLVNNAGVIEGHVGSAAGALAFTVSVSSAGVVTLDQIRALSHPDATNPDDNVTFAADNLVTLTATARDFDADTASVTINIAQNLNFEDDGPTIDVTLSATAEPSLITQDSETDGTPTAQDTASASFAGNFSVSQNYGADGAGTVATIYALGVSSQGVSSNLTSAGAAIYLYNIGGVVVGSTSNTQGGVTAGNTIFNVAVDAAGTVTLTQFAQIDHTTADPSPTGTPFIDHVASLTDTLVTLTATSTVTDRDGDQASDSQVLNIGAQLQFQDDGPDISAVLTGTQIRIDETDGVVAAGGEVDPVGGNLGTVTVAAATLFTVSNPNLSADTPTTLSYALTLSAQGVDSGLDLSTTNANIYLYNIGGTVYGSTSATEAGVNAGNTAFTVSINAGTGAVTLTQFLAVEHPTGGSSHDEDSSGLTAGVLNVTITGTDFDGDTDAASVDLGSVIRFEDDGPTIDVLSNPRFEPILLTQDTQTDGTPTTQDSDSSSINFNNAFALLYTTGSDGAATPTLSYALGVTTSVSGLTQGGVPINLYLINGTVVGSTSATQGGVNAGNTVFDITVSATGVVTQTQYSQIDHTTTDPSPTGGPFEDHVVTLPDEAVTLTASSTITDNDGDTASDSATLNIGNDLQFADDGPDISAVLTGTQIRIDETDGVVAAGGEVDPVGGNLGTVTVAAATLFTVSTVNLSADTPTTTAYALTLSAQGVDSGLDVSSNNATIYLYNIGGTVYGSTSATEGGVNAGNTAFTVSINATTGAITLTQFLAIEHPTPGSSHDEDSSALAAGVLNVTVTATDFDGDTDAASVDLGSIIRFEDDGPSATNDTDTISGGAGPATGNVLTGTEVAVAEDANNTDGNADNVGQDTPGTITFIASNNVPANTDGTYTSGNLVVNGQYGTLTINANGDYSYTRTNLGVGGVSDVFTYTLTDADGDTVTATLTIGIEDAFPTAGTRNVVIDDDDVSGAGGNPNGPNDDAPSNATGTLPGSGGNGTLTRSFAAVGDQPALPAGFTYGTVDADTIQILQGGTLVLTIQITDPTTGAYTVTQNAPILHPTQNGDPTFDNTENNVDFTVNYIVTDGDGDTANGTMNISVDDDTPTINVTKGDDSAVILTTDDAQTTGINTDTAQSTANFSGVFGLAQSAGADGTAAAATLQYTLDVTGYAGGPAGVDSGLNQGGNNIYLYEIGGKVVGSTSATLAGVTPGNTVFDVAVNGSGVVTLTQYSQIDHVGGDPTPTGTPFNDHIVSMADGLVTLTASATLTDNDGDTVTDSEVVNIGANLRFTDDGPSAAIVETGQSVSLDESVNNQIDSNDTTAPAVIALFAGVTNTGTDTHLPQYAQNASAIVASTGSAYGADGAGTTVFSLNVSAAGVDSGLNTTAGQDILLYKEGNLIVGRVSGGPDDGKAALAIAIDPVTGVISTVEYLSIYHPNATNPDDSVSIADGAVLAVVTVTDFDGDTATQQVGIGSAIQFQDSAPVMTAAENMNIQNSGDVAHTAAFAFHLGADGANTTNDVITNVTGSATVGGAPVTNWVLTANVDALGNPAPETATTATYAFSFTYSIGNGNTAQATGTLVFNKVAGTYTIDLANPIQGVTTILQTATGTLFQGYEYGTSTPDGSQPAISVTQIQDLAGTANDIYVQFTSVSEPSSGTGDDNLEVTNWVPGANNPPPVNGGGDTSWSAGQLFNQTDGWVSTSNSANGVDGDTIQGGEVLDFSLVQGANPTGTLAAPGTYAQASAMFLTFDGIGTGEDMIVILKLYDPNTNTYTTRAVMVENADIFKGPADNDPNTAAPSLPAPYSSITLDNNDGFVVIESNDYNLPGENWVIVGAQIAGSDEDVTGTAINLNSATGVAGDSYTGNAFDLDPDGFQSDTNDGPFKISSIGFVTTNTTPQNAQLTFDVTVTDGDGDSITQTVTATVTSAVDSVSAATIPAGNTTVSMEAPSTKGATSTLLSATEQQQAANTNSVLLGAIAGAGLMSASAAAAAPSFDFATMRFDGGADEMSLLSSTSLRSGDHYGLIPMAESPFGAQVDGSIMANDGLSLSSETVSSKGVAAPVMEAPDLSQLPQGNDVPVASQAAEASSFATGDVAMPSLEALIASVGQQGANAQATGDVAQVLADALAGGGGADIDGLLASLPGGGGNGVDALASHDMAAVSAWDMGAFGGFSTIHQAFTMETLVLHQDATIQQA